MNREFFKGVKGRIFIRKKEEVSGRWVNRHIVEFGNL
jgi:hypothetical protein